MINLHLYDDQHHIFITGYYRPQEVIAPRQAPWQHVSSGAPLKLLRNDGELAVLVSTLAGGLADLWLRRRGCEGLASNLVLESWILGPPESASARLASWFSGEREETRYRVAIHHTPRAYKGCLLPALWDEVYDELEATGAVRIARRPLLTAAAAEAFHVAQEGLTVYRDSPREVTRFIRGLGHPSVLALAPRRNEGGS